MKISKGAVTLAIFPSTFSEFVVDCPKKSTSFRTLVVTHVLLHTVIVVVKTCKQTASAVSKIIKKKNLGSYQCFRRFLRKNSLCLCICIFIYQFIHSFFKFIFLIYFIFYFYLYFLFYLFIHLFITYLFVYFLIYLSIICLFIYLSFYPSFF